MSIRGSGVCGSSDAIRNPRGADPEAVLSTGLYVEKGKAFVDLPGRQHIFFG